MKKIFMLAAILFCMAGYSQKNKGLKDGFYEVAELVYDTSQARPLAKGTVALEFNQQFKDDAPEEYTRVIVFNGEFVPLELEQLPVLENKPGLKSRLRISLSPEASAKLKGFTEKRVMKQVAIVMNGEVLTVHKIRTVITGKDLEISRCTDSACEKLQVMMRNNVKH